MNKQYKSRVFIYEEIYVTWWSAIRTFKILTRLKNITTDHRTSIIRNFYHKETGELPSKYHYSSGLNHSRGYK
jgi:hypothetical protein